MKIFHHNDLDGKVSAAVVLFLKGGGGKVYANMDLKEIDCVAMNYTNSINLKDIQEGEEVWILDYSIPPNEMRELLKITNRVFWIDHHKTAIEKYKDAGIEVLGLRKVDKAGCELTWEYCFKNSNYPDLVKYVGDRDVWRWQYGKTTKFFCCGLLQYSDNVYLLSQMINLDPSVALKLINNGKIVDLWLQKRNKAYLEAYGFIGEFEGHTAIVCNHALVGSEFFDSCQEYKLLILFVFTGQRFAVSLYSRDGLDVSELAKKYGGGGHHSAAGFQCRELPVKFIKKLNE